MPLAIDANWYFDWDVPEQVSLSVPVLDQTWSRLTPPIGEVAAIEVSMYGAAYRVGKPARG